MSAPAAQRLDIDMGSTEDKQAVEQFAARSGQSATGFARALLLAAIGRGEAREGMRLPRDRRGYRAAARMMRCAVMVRAILERALDRNTDERTCAELRDALEEVTRAISELG